MTMASWLFYTGAKPVGADPRSTFVRTDPTRTSRIAVTSRTGNLRSGAMAHARTVGDLPTRIVPRPRSDSLRTQENCPKITGEALRTRSRQNARLGRRL